MTVTWIQLNSQLLRLTGDARYGDELERTYYNHLSAAQRPDGAMWCYFTALEGTKPYGPGINCCVSSGPRGMALTPQVAFLKFRDSGGESLAVNFFESADITTTLGGQKVTVNVQSEFPRKGVMTLTIKTEKPATFGLRVRSPQWAEPLRVRADGQEVTGPRGGWATISAREWKNGDRVTVTFNLAARTVIGEHTNVGRAALAWGPIVLAYDEGKNRGLPSAPFLGLTDSQPPCMLKPATLADPRGSVGGGVPLPLTFEAKVISPRDKEAKTAVFVPFADAGSDGSRYRIWLRAPGAKLPENASRFAFARESRSRQGNVVGDISDGDFRSFVVTFDGTARDEDWFAVSLDEPVTVRRIVYAHGRTFHDGGWFDASAGKPRVQIQRTKGGAWETVGTLDDYPATTATDPKGLRQGEAFTLRLKEPVTCLAIRVIGRPACGDNPNQAFASCAELQGFGE